MMLDMVLSAVPIKESSLKMLRLAKKQEQLQAELRNLGEELALAEEKFVSDVHNHFSYLPDELILNFKHESVYITFDTDDGTIRSVSSPNQLNIDVEV